MTIGRVIPKVVLDDPRALHYGAMDDIRGNIEVSFDSKSTDELFGPMQLLLVLEGRAKTKIRVHNVGENTFTTYRGRAPLISITTLLHDGPVRIQSHMTEYFPFNLQFPASVMPVTRDEFLPDPRFEMDPCGPLPPSLSYGWMGIVNPSFDAFVEYRLRIVVSMPQIDVKIEPYGETDCRLIYYEQPPILSSPSNNAAIRTVRDTLRISNEFLLPEHDRPHGFRQRTKNFFKSDAYPTFAATFAVDGSSNLFLQQPITFHITMLPKNEENTSPDVPHIELKSFEIKLKSMTVCRAQAGTGNIFGGDSCRESQGEDKALVLSAEGLDRDPFSIKTNYTKTVSTRPLSGVPTTFSTFNIARTYSAEIEYAIEVAGKTKKFGQEFIPVKVLPPAISQQGRNAPGFSSGLSYASQVPPLAYDTTC